MDSILQQITDWLKEMLVSAIMGNLSGMFESVNNQVGEIATSVGMTPANFSPGVFAMVRNISESVIIPIAGLILTFIACYELIQMIIDHNNLANFETWIFFKWVFKTFVAVMLITNTYYIDEFHLLLKEEQTATYSVEIWKRFRKWGGLPTGITQNVKDLLRSPEIANILENSDFIYMLNQASDDRSILAQRLNISPHQLSYVTNSGEGEGLLFYGNVILPFIDRFPTDLELYRIMTTKLNEVAQEKEA